MQEWTIRTVLSWARLYFEKKGIDTPRLDAEVLLAHALDCTRIDLYLDMDRPLVQEELSRFRALIRRRSEREPVAYITGEKEFFGKKFAISRHVLIPRPESEILVEQAIDLVPMSSEILEIGAGSGAVIISILDERPDIKAVACDISIPALSLSAHNARVHNVTGRLRLFAGDLFGALSHKFSTIVANPPYIALVEKDILTPEVLRFEPKEALFAGKTGMDIILKIIHKSPDYILQGGYLIMEFGYSQKGNVEKAITGVGSLVINKWVKDLSGKERVVVAQRM